MIKLTRLNGQEIVVNPELIEWMEAHPDTTISLATGSKIVVKEKVDAVIERVMDYRKRLFSEGTFPVESLLKSYRKETR